MNRSHAALAQSQRGWLWAAGVALAALVLACSLMAISRGLLDPPQLHLRSPWIELHAITTGSGPCRLQATFPCLEERFSGQWQRYYRVGLIVRYSDQSRITDREYVLAFFQLQRRGRTAEHDVVNN